MNVACAIDGPFQTRLGGGQQFFHDYTAGDNPRVDLLKLLLEAGADVDAKDKRGRTTLYLAATHEISSNGLMTEGVYQVVQLLLDSGIDVQAADAEGQTARDIAVEMNNTQLVQMLSERMEALEA